MSSLEDFLYDQRAAGQYESSGKFTIHRAEAVRKVAAYQLPDASSWILKIVQAVVASGAEALVVHLTASETVVEFRPKSIWTRIHVEDAFFDPEPDACRGLEHLKRGLWNVALQQLRPFQLTLPNEPGSLFWDGQWHWREHAPQNYARLTVSHRSAETGLNGRLPFMAAPQINASLTTTLAHNSYCCPIPLSLDGLRLDGLQACPTQGFARDRYPLVLAVADAPLPALGVPPGTWKGYKVESVGELQPQLLVAQAGRQPGVAALVTLHARCHRDRRQNEVHWIVDTSHSYVHWVYDGVIVAQEELPLGRHPVTMAMFLSAEGMATDVSGLRLRSNDGGWQRVKAAQAALQPLLADLSLDRLRKGRMGPIGKGLAAVVLLGGLGYACSFQPFFLYVAGRGLVSLFTDDSTAELNRLMQQEFAQFKLTFCQTSFS